MTVDECIDKVVAVCASAIILPPPNPREVNTCRDDVRVALRALLYTESERAAEIARNITQGETGMHYGEEAAKKILATSPGKVKP